jgi:thiopeptide-type bacteriocin biosynthesis protein
MIRAMRAEAPVVTPAGFFVLRTPLLPVDELAAWSAELAAPDADGDRGRLADAAARDGERLRARLRTIVDRPDVREALFVASRSLHDSLPLWLAQPDSVGGIKVERTLVRYLLRMTSRATPFGLFAGCSLGKIGDETRLCIGERRDYRRHSRIDGDYLASLVDALGADPRFRRVAIYRPNSSLYRLGGQLRYVEPGAGVSGRVYRLTAVEPDPPLEQTLERARAGARLDQLAQALVDDQITRGEADEFVAELVDSQLLVSNFEPQLTGDEPLPALIAILGATDEAEVTVTAQTLARVQAGLRSLDELPLGAEPAAYRAFVDQLSQLSAPIDPGLLVQVDLVKPPAPATLGPEIIAELQRVFALLHRCALPADGLAHFRETFERRYGTREVPLAEALDDELGIGFEHHETRSASTSPLLDGLAFETPRPSEVRSGPFFPVLLERLHAALADGADEIVLDEGDLAKMAALAAAVRGTDTPPPLADSLVACITVAGPGEPGVAEGDFRMFLHAVGGPSGAIALGRFCHADPRLHELVRAHLAVEAGRVPDALVAEIVHLPQGRAANVLVRPLLREWELVYLGRSGAPVENQLSLDDLLVSVRDGRVVLRSRRHQREVVPRLTSAHRFDNRRNLAMYRFLGALQSQGLAIVGFQWASLESAPYLPRVRQGRTVLALARWRLEARELAPIVQSAGAARFTHVQALRRARRLPRWVAIADGDQVLPIDLHNVLALDAVVPLLKGRRHVTVTELFGHDGACARGPEGRFAHELMVPLLATPRDPPKPAVSSGRSSQPRRCASGSEWLYAKLYTGETTADAILRDVIAPVVATGRTRGAVAEWFFVRYRDPDPHLRVRFRGEPARLRRVVLPVLERAVATALASGRMWRFVIDTYEREVERYGGDTGILISEQLFCADSDAVLAVLDALPSDDVNARWHVTLRAMDLLLDDLGMPLVGKHHLLQSLGRGFRREHHAEGSLARQLGERFRAHRTALEALLDGDGLAPPLADALARRTQTLAPVVAHLRAQVNAGRLGVSPADLAACYLHMHANRMFAGAARAHELVIYDFLERLYEGQMARSKLRQLSS